MKRKNFVRVGGYVFIILSFFVVVFILDQVFHVEYAPDEHKVVIIKEGSTSEQVRQASLDFEPEPEIQSGDVTMGLASTTEEKTVESTQQFEKIMDNDAETLVAFFQRLEKDYSEKLRKELPAGKSRTDITIRYYKHAPDGKSAYALQKLGYYIHERPVDPSYEKFQSNAIYYGDSVGLMDVQMVAYTLLKQGLPLKVITKSRFGDNWKARSIEVGADSTVLSNRTLTLEDIQALKL